MLSQWIIRTFIKDYENTDHPKVRNRYGHVASMVGIILNVLLFATKFLIGFFTHSISIMADAANNLSDFSSSLISLWGFKMSAKPADRDHPHGHGRYEYVAGFVVSVFIFIIGLTILRSGVSRIIHPVDMAYTVTSLIIMALSILVKFWMMLFYNKTGKLIDSATLRASAVDSRNDVLTTGGVVLAALLTYLTNFNLDGYVAVLMALFILWSGFELIRDTLNPIIGEAPSPETLAKIEEFIQSSDLVIGLHDIELHDYGPDRIWGSVHVEMDKNLTLAQAHKVADRIESLAEDRLGIQLTVHVDPVEVLEDKVYMAQDSLSIETKEPRQVTEEVNPSDCAK
jgi:cation diffusion facilitator family transporter